MSDACSTSSGAHGTRLKFTGERCLPDIDDVQVVYEHLHRYHFAASLAEGKRVLDVGSGEGYGASILAERAASVVGVDIDAASIEHSRATYVRDNLEFVAASALDLRQFIDGGFDLIVCFEVIEHIADQAQLLAEIWRLLTAGGLLVLSTPDRNEYNRGRAEPNPFHVRELNENELRGLLSSRFSRVALWGQRVVVGSEIVRRDRRETAEETALRFGLVGPSENWAISHRRPLMYLVAIASSGELPSIAGLSVLSDESATLVRRQEQLAAEQRRLAAEQEQLAAKRLELVASTEETLRHVEAERKQLERARDVLERRVVRLERDAAVAQARAYAAEQHLAMVLGSRGWRVLEALRPLMPRRPRRTSDTSRADSAPWKEHADALSGAAPVSVDSIQFPIVESPLVSIVVPVRDNCELTLRCLSAVASNSDGAFEVVAVDDASGVETARSLEAVAGLRVERSEENIGFLRACNRGATVARGRYLVFLNNDTEVQEGWLDALLETIERASDIGAVGGKLLFPDGRLQEAGGVLWSDATGWNYGRGQDPHAPQFNYTREVDYCSGALLMVRRDIFEDLGKFDLLFSPAYYEDTDLCFALRAAGFRTLYEPKCVAIHHEGASYGTDDRPVSLGKGSKEAQSVNRAAFVQKWSHELAHQRPPGDAAGWLGGRYDDRLRVLVADTWVPAYDRDAGSLRMMWILRLLRRLDCDVTFFPQNRLDRDPYSAELRALGCRSTRRAYVVRELCPRESRTLRRSFSEQTARGFRVSRTRGSEVSACCDSLRHRRPAFCSRDAAARVSPDGARRGSDGCASDRT